MLRRLLGRSRESHTHKVSEGDRLWAKIEKIESSERRVKLLLTETGIAGCSVYLGVGGHELNVSLPREIADDMHVATIVATLRSALGKHAPVTNERSDPSLKNPRAMLAVILAEVAHREGSARIPVNVSQK